MCHYGIYAPGYEKGILEDRNTAQRGGDGNVQRITMSGNHIRQVMALPDENNEKGVDHGKDGSRQEVDIHGVYGRGQ
jgi:hypothetical protein